MNVASSLVELSRLKKPIHVYVQLVQDGLCQGQGDFVNIAEKSTDEHILNINQ